MQQKYCIKQECLRKAQGAFLLAHKMGLLEDPSMEGAGGEAVLWTTLFFSTGVFAV